MFEHYKEKKKQVVQKAPQPSPPFIEKTLFNVDAEQTGVQGEI